MSDLLADRYRRVASLGSGAMGEVWLADDLVLGRRVAVKQLRVGVGGDAGSVERMVREARAAARLHHPNAVSVHDLVTVGGQPYLIMEYVEGETLDERLRRVGRLPVAEACAIVGQVARALEAAHSQGVVHRDVKPANVMLTPAGVAKLADFGIARQEGDTSLTAPGHAVGTLAFMAPEALSADGATAASDVWSLGATLFAAVEGRPPFVEDDAAGPLLYRLMTTPAPPAAHAGPAAGVIAGMLDREPTRRPSAGEVGRRLAVAQSAPTVPNAASVPTTQRPYAAPPPPPARVDRHDLATAPATQGAPARTRRTLLALAAVVVLVAAGVLAHVLTSNGSGSGPSGQKSSSAPPTGSSTSVSSSPTPTPNTVVASPDALFANPTQVTSILADARTDTIALLSYDYRHLDEHDQQVASLTTGSFRDHYLDLVRESIDPLAKANQIVLAARVAAVGIGPFNGTTATVLAFDDTTRTDPDGTTTNNSYSTTLQLRLVLGRWLVAGMTQDEPIRGNPPGSAGLGAAVSAGRTAAVRLTSLTKAGVGSQLAALRSRATGEFLRTFDAATAAARAAATGGENDVGTVRSSAVSSAAASTADVLFDIKQTGTRAGKAFTPRRVRLDVTLTRVGTQWLVSGVQNFG